MFPPLRGQCEPAEFPPVGGEGTYFEQKWLVYEEVCVFSQHHTAAQAGPSVLKVPQGLSGVQGEHCKNEENGLFIINCIPWKIQTQESV